MIKNEVESTADVCENCSSDDIVSYKILFKSISQSNGINAF